MEDREPSARRVDMKLAFLAVLLLLAAYGVLAELARGRRPVLITRPGERPPT
jgi:hypothetical protein